MTPKVHAVVSLLDKKNDQVVQALSDELEKTFGTHPRYKTPVPHFTYQGATEYDFDKLDRKLRRFAERTQKFRIHAGGLGMFTGFTPVLYIPVVRTLELSKFHVSLWRSISSAGTGLSRDYDPKFWVPHITLAQGGITEHSLKKGMGRLSRREIELDITVDNLSLIWFDGKKHTLRSRYSTGGQALKTLKAEGKN